VPSINRLGNLLSPRGEQNKNVEYRILNDCAHERGIEEALVDTANKFKSITPY
jgi:hypothetical protein